MDVNFIFTNLLAIDHLDLNTKKLEIYSFKKKKTDLGKIVSNYGGWQSNFLDLRDPEIESLSSSIMLRVNELKTQLGILNDFYLDNMWININGPGDFNKPHIHPGSFFSGAFYIKVNKNSGSLVFKNQYPGHECFFGNLRLTKSNHFTSGNWIIEPEPNMLVLFPSLLEHYVLPNTSKEDRISISFNINYVT